MNKNVRVQLSGWYGEELKRLAEYSGITPTQLVKQFITTAYTQAKDTEHVETITKA